MDAPVIRYHGGKWRLAPKLIALFPTHTTYVEPFGGGAGVFLRKPPAVFNVYNDLDGGVVNFFQVLRDTPDALIRAIELTPYSRAEFESSTERTGDPVEDARRFYVFAWQSLSGGPGNERTGWRSQKQINGGANAIGSWGRVEHLHEAARFIRKHMQIEQDDALAVIERYDTPDTLFYCDPPYTEETRSSWAGDAYNHDTSEALHRSLAAALAGIQGYAVVSGYECPLYNELFAGWERRDFSAQTIRGGNATESVWLSPSVSKALNEEYDGLPLFCGVS